MDADSRKGTLCPFCVPIHEKKKKKIDILSLPVSVKEDSAGPTGKFM